jgi:hypothetical protein
MVQREMTVTAALPSSQSVVYTSFEVYMSVVIYDTMLLGCDVALLGEQFPTF